MIHDSLLFIVVAIWIWRRIACSLRGRLTVLNTFCLCLQKSIRVTLALVTRLRSLANGLVATQPSNRQGKPRLVLMLPRENRRIRLL